MPVPAIVSNFLDCFACCGQGAKDARHDQYLQPLNLLPPTHNTVSGAAAAAAAAEAPPLQAALRGSPGRRACPASSTRSG